MPLDTVSGRTSSKAPRGTIQWPTPGPNTQTDTMDSPAWTTILDDDILTLVAKLRVLGADEDALILHPHLREQRDAVAVHLEFLLRHGLTVAENVENAENTDASPPPPAEATPQASSPPGETREATQEAVADAEAVARITPPHPSATATSATIVQAPRLRQDTLEQVVLVHPPALAWLSAPDIAAIPPSILRGVLRRQPTVLGALPEDLVRGALAAPLMAVASDSPRVILHLRPHLLDHMVAHVDIALTAAPELLKLLPEDQRTASRCREAVQRDPSLFAAVPAAQVPALLPHVPLEFAATAPAALPHLPPAAFWDQPLAVATALAQHGEGIVYVPQAVLLAHRELLWNALFGSEPSLACTASARGTRRPWDTIDAEKRAPFQQRPPQHLLEQRTYAMAKRALRRDLVPVIPSAAWAAHPPLAHLVIDIDSTLLWHMPLDLPRVLRQELASMAWPDFVQSRMTKDHGVAPAERGHLLAFAALAASAKDVETYLRVSGPPGAYDAMAQVLLVAPADDWMTLSFSDDRLLDAWLPLLMHAAECTGDNLEDPPHAAVQTLRKWLAVGDTCTGPHEGATAATQGAPHDAAISQQHQQQQQQRRREPRLRSVALLEKLRNERPLWFTLPRERRVAIVATRLARLIATVKEYRPPHSPWHRDAAWHTRIQRQTPQLLRLLATLPRSTLEDPAWSPRWTVLAPHLAVPSPLPRDLPLPLYSALVDARGARIIPELPAELRHTVLGAAAGTDEELQPLLAPALRAAEEEEAWLRRGDHVLQWLRAKGITLPDPLPMPLAVTPPDSSTDPPPCPLADMPRAWPAGTRELLGRWAMVLEADTDTAWSFVPAWMRPLLAPTVWRWCSSPESLVRYRARGLAFRKYGPCPVPSWCWFQAWLMLESGSFPWNHLQGDAQRPGNALPPDVQMCLARCACLPHAQGGRGATAPPLPAALWSDAWCWRATQPSFLARALTLQPSLFPETLHVPEDVALTLMQEQCSRPLLAALATRDCLTPSVSYAALRAMAKEQWNGWDGRITQHQQWPPLVLAAYAKAGPTRAAWVQRAQQEGGAEDCPGQAFLATWAQHVAAMGDAAGNAYPATLEPSPWFEDDAAWGEMQPAAHDAYSLWATDVMWQPACGHFRRLPRYLIPDSDSDNSSEGDWEDDESEEDTRSSSSTSSSSDSDSGNSRSRGGDDPHDEGDPAADVAFKGRDPGDTKECEGKEEENETDVFYECGCKPSEVKSCICVPAAPLLPGMHSLREEVARVLQRAWTVGKYRLWEELLRTVLAPRLAASCLADLLNHHSPQVAATFRQQLPLAIAQHPVFLALSPALPAATATTASAPAPAAEP